MYVYACFHCYLMFEKIIFLSRTKMQSQMGLLRTYIFKKHAKNASVVSIFYAFSFFMENA